MTFSLLISLFAISHSISDIGTNTLEEGSEVQLAHYKVSRKQIETNNEIGKNFEIVRRNKNDFEIYVPVDQIEKFKKMAPHAKLISSDTREQLMRNLALSSRRYRSFSEVQSELLNIEKKFPSIAKLSIIGKSKLGKPIYALKISDHVSRDENEKELLLTAATHGDELITVEVMLTLIDEIVKGYSSNQRITKFVDQRELFFVPVVNPDGFSRRSRYSGRYDPNRAFPNSKGRQRFQVKCIETLMRFFNKRNFSASIDFHAYGELIMYPLAESRKKTPDDSKFSYLASDMAQNTSYRTGQISRVLYRATGSSADYFYNQNRTMAYAVELTRSKVPNLANLASIMTDARELTFKFIEEEHYLR